MKLLERVHEFMKKIGFSDQDIESYDSSSVYLAEEIALYAHHGQRRVNGAGYFSHPLNVLNNYRKLVGIVENDYFCLDVDLLYACEIPYDGVQEVCLLHDVVEDADITIDEIREAFDDLGLGSYFDARIKTALTLLTHDSSQDYHDYITNVLTDPVASMVKFMDMSDNMNPSTLDKLGDKEVERICKYAVYCKAINEKWHFLENSIKYFMLKNQKSKKAD